MGNESIEASLNVTMNMTLESKFALNRTDVNDAFNIATTYELK